MEALTSAATQGNPGVLIGAGVGLLIVLLSGPFARSVAWFNRLLSRSPPSAVSPLLNKERQDAIHQSLREGGDGELARWFAIFGGVLFIVLSILLYLGVIS